MASAKRNKTKTKTKTNKKTKIKNPKKQGTRRLKPHVYTSTIFCHNGICVKKSNYGLGTFATKNIPANTTILKEKPHRLDEPRHPEYIYKLIRRLMDDPVTKPQLESLVPLSVDPAKDRVEPYDETMQESHKKYLPELTPEQLQLLHTKIMRNWFSCDKQPGILFNGTRLNHSCDSNVSYHMDGDHMVFQTKRPVKKNEELFDSYINGNLPFDERQSELKRRYGFDCGCDKCIKRQ